MYNIIYDIKQHKTVKMIDKIYLKINNEAKIIA